MSLLEVREVVVRFGGITALDNVSFDLNRGEVLGLIGPNGAGKTTLFNTISGVLPPDRGDVRFEGRSIARLKPHQRARRGIARTFQNLQLWPTMTVLENLKLPMDALGGRNIVSDALGLPFSSYAEKASTQRARATLHALELLEHESRLAGDLPVGVQRRVEIARALCLRPKLLLLDEPAAGLDHEETLHLADLLHRIRDRFKVSILLVDHDMSLVMKACEYIYVLDFGKLLASGRPDEVRNNPLVISAYLGEAGKDEQPEEAEVPMAPSPNPSHSILAAYEATFGSGATLAEEPTPTTSIVPVSSASNGSSSSAVAATEPRQFETLLEVQDLAGGYGRLEVIRDVNLQVGAGEVVACIGANGAGKTTTLRAISGVIRPMRGRVTFEGRDITRSTPQAIVKLGLLHVPQGRGLFAKLTVEETLRLAAYSGHRGGDFSAAFDTFPVLSRRRHQVVGSLSGGEQQMLALARALLVKPKLLMVDEMSQGLAPAVVQRLFGYLEAFKTSGTAVLLVEQFVDAALSIADRAYVFEQGTIKLEERASVLRRDQKLIASSYLGSTDDDPTPAGVNGAAGDVAQGADKTMPKSAELMEEMVLKLPAELKRSIQEQAAREGRPPDEVLLEILGGDRR